MSLWTTKSLDRLREEADAGTMHRVLGPVQLTLIGVGAIIGAGIFVLTGQAAAQYAGPAIVLSFVISGLACVFAGLCYAEFASMIPISGSAYTYAYATLGELIAWTIGWDLILEYSLGAATVAVGWSGYVVSFLRDVGIHLPPELVTAAGTQSILADGTVVTGVFNAPAALIVLVVTALLVVGIRESARANAAIVAIKFSVILLFIIFGMKFIQPSNWQPFVPANDGAFGVYGWSGVLRAAGVIFFAYIGFDAVSTAAQEARNPQKDMPVGILTSLAICTLLYIMVAAVLTGIVPFRELNVADPMAVGVDATGLAWLKPLIKLGAIAGLSSVILVMLMAQPRIFYSMSRDGLLPPMFSRIHPRFRTPHVTTMMTGGVVALAAGLLPIGILAEMVAIGTLLAFVLVCAGIIVLRRTQPGMPRPFRTPLVPLVPLLGVFICLAQMAALPWPTWERLLIWLGLGMVVYWGYGKAGAERVRRQQEDVVGV
ncbi:MAG TPA: amino acid permease [Longimicrobiales bacterium]|nr:amino acid permease [Longimicrobiales bacterium]